MAALIIRYLEGLGYQVKIHTIGDWIMCCATGEDGHFYGACVHNMQENPGLESAKELAQLVGADVSAIAA